jgi:L-ascorbate metabolism protein UlaG (beta-lactamase superfamily)
MTMAGSSGSDQALAGEVAAEAVAFHRSPVRGRVAPRSGRAFVDAVASFTPPPGTLAVWYLGQESVIWKVTGADGAASTLWIDPYLSPNPARRYPPFCAPEEVRDAEAVLITHEHADHLDPFTCGGIARNCPTAVFVAPAVCRPMLLRAGVPEERVRTPHTGEPIRLGPWKVVSVPCAHEEVDFEPSRGHRWTGYIASAHGLACYHAGDGVACDELLAALRPWIGRLDLAMLPINGRDYFRRREDCFGNFTFREAAEIAARLDAGLTVPMHYDLFHGYNDERPAHFVDYVYDKTPYLPIAVMAPGQRLLVAPRANPA